MIIVFWGKETQRVTHGWGINKLNNDFLKMANAMGIAKIYDPTGEDKSKSMISDINYFSAFIITCKTIYDMRISDVQIVYPTA